MTEQKTVVTAPKDYTFQLRMNSEIKAELERIYAEQGMTLSDAFNVFMQQTLNMGGLPFRIGPGDRELYDAIRFLSESFRQGMRSAEDGGWVPSEEARRILDDEE